MLRAFKILKICFIAVSVSFRKTNNIFSKGLLFRFILENLFQRISYCLGNQREKQSQ